MTNWENACLAPQNTIREAMRLIDNTSLRLALVIDNQKKLLGTVTDGDIRRALLANANMHDFVETVMNCSPFVANPDMCDQVLLELLERKDLLAVPIVDSQNKLIDLVTLKELLIPQPVDNPVFIMAGGFGTRLAPLTDSCPKPMLPVGEQPILEIIVRQLSSQGFKNIFISTHYMAEVIIEHFQNGEEFDVNIEYVNESSPMGTGGALGLLPDGIGELPMIVINGDVLTDLKFRDMLKKYHDLKCDSLMCTRELEYKISYGVVNENSGYLHSMVEKPTYRYQINTGIYVISAECINSVAKDEKVDLPTVLERRKSSGKTVGTYLHRGYWLDIGQMEDYQQAQIDILSLSL